MSDQATLEGFLSVDAALRAGNRDIAAILLRRDKQDGPARHLERLAASRKIPVQRVSNEEIAAQVGGTSHGGVLAHVGPRRFLPLEALLSGGSAFLAMIDGVEDPFNFGQAVRSLYAAGAGGLVVRPRNWMSAAGIVARASAGASELIPTAMAETAGEAADFYRAQGCAVACATDERSAVSIYETDLTHPLFILIGGEKRGITRSFLAQADLCLRIPYGRPDAQALGTAAATAVLAFEVMRQRSAKAAGQ